MKILVVIRQVPDSTTNIKIRPDGEDIVRDGVKMVLNPFDEFAIEQAVRLREAKIDVESITALLVYSGKSPDAMRTTLAIGADDGIHLQDEACDKLDELQLAAVIAALVRDAGYDLILIGKMEIDLDTGELGPALAELLDIPHVGVTTKLEVAADGKAFVANRRIEGADEILEIPLPALLACEKGLCEPRYPSLPNLMKAKKKPVKVITSADVPGFAELVAEYGGTTVHQLEPPPERPPGKILQGEPEEVVPELVRLLRHEAKVI
ncbi:MAG: electron transfer flavoprotein subunit beta/FixA family protein [Planctomycetes bacterium]|nr:electron transfer flavoprotein subunit beta/FixA family protein [Planctomycetota bacterium]